MNTLLFVNRLLLSRQGSGLLWILLLFLLCFVCVHILKLAQVGWEHTKKTPPPPEPPKEEKKAPAKQEPIYYLVERTKRRPKNGYKEPKKISFK